MPITNQTLISAKVNDKLYDTLKIEFIRKNFKLQKLIERSMFLYLTDNNFQKQIHNTLDTSLED